MALTINSANATRKVTLYTDKGTIYHEFDQETDKYIKDITVNQHNVQISWFNKEEITVFH